MESGEKERSAASNESDDENSQEKNDAATPGGEKQKRVHAPRKKFEWTPNVR